MATQLNTPPPIDAPPPTHASAPNIEPQPSVHAEPPDPMEDGLLDAINQAKTDQDAAAAADDARDAADKPDDATDDKPEPKEAEPKDDATPKDKAKLEIKPTEPEEAPSEIPENAPVPRKAEEWRKFKASYNEKNALLKDREAKLAEWEQRRADIDQMDAIRAERDSLAAQLKESSVVGDPTITAPIDSAIEGTLESAKETLSEEQVGALQGIARLPAGKYRTEQLKAFVEGLEDWQKPIAGSHITELSKLSHQREKAIQHARENVEQILQERQAKMQAAEAQQAEVHKRTFNNVVNEFKGKEGWKDIFEQQDFAKEWLDAAQSTFQGKGGTPSDLARKALMAEIAPALLQNALDTAKAVADRDGKIEELNQIIQDLRGSTPRPETYQQTTGIGSAESEDPFVDGLAKTLDSLR
jgi:hypothetical protein